MESMKPDAQDYHLGIYYNRVLAIWDDQYDFVAIDCRKTELKKSAKDYLLSILLEGPDPEFDDCINKLLDGLEPELRGSVINQTNTNLNAIVKSLST